MMPDYSGHARVAGRVALVVSRYHERITERLLEGAQRACREAGLPAEAVDVLRVPGAFELGVAATAAARSGRYAAVVALGAVVRGETPHFDYVAGDTSAALQRAATDTLVPVGMGLLTCDTMAQAEARAGGAAGNKGHEAAEAALRTASMLGEAGLS